MTKTIPVITVLSIPLDGPPVEREIPANELGDELHTAVGGYVQCIPLAATGLHLWVHEEGKLIGLEPNANAQALWDFAWGPRTDFVVGNAVITGGADRNGDTKPLDAGQRHFLRAFYAG